MRFSMTLDGLHKIITTSVLLLMLGVIAGLYLAFGGVELEPRLSREILQGLPLGLFAIGLIFALSFAWAPCGVEIIGGRLRILRRAWAALEIPLQEIASVELGPEQGLKGAGWRLLGNGGFFGSYGWFWNKQLGLYRLWATRMGRPVILRRRSGKPVALIVDEPEKLLDALRAQGLT